MRKVFVSYSHQHKDWVRGRLIPVLRAAGLKVLCDASFLAGKSLLGQMDLTQDQAERHVLVLTPCYLSSGNCKHEMHRAIALDPNFETGTVIPVVRADVRLPEEIRRANPFYVRLDDRTERDSDAWSQIIRACDGRTGWSVPEWIDARDEVRLFLGRRQSVSLVVSGKSPWRPLVEELDTNYTAQIDLDSPATYTDRGLVSRILQQLGSNLRMADERSALAELEDFLGKFEAPPTVALLHFDRAGKRFNGDFFGSLRYLIDQRLLVALFQSRQPFTAIVPKEDPLSSIDLKRVDLQ